MNSKTERIFPIIERCVNEKYAIASDRLNEKQGVEYYLMAIPFFVCAVVLFMCLVLSFDVARMDFSHFIVYYIMLMIGIAGIVHVVYLNKNNRAVMNSLLQDVAGSLTLIDRLSQLNEVLYHVKRFDFKSDSFKAILDKGKEIYFPLSLPADVLSEINQIESESETECSVILKYRSRKIVRI